jgi:exonuclease III
MLQQLRMSSLNCNVLRTKSKRRSLLKQLVTHSDIACLQETYADRALMYTISTEFPGFWIAPHSASAHSTGVAIGITTTNGITRLPEDNHIDLEGGRLVGIAVKTSDNTKYFIISAYSPCLFSSTQVWTPCIPQPSNKSCTREKDCRLWTTNLIGRKDKSLFL